MISAEPDIRVADNWADEGTILLEGRDWESRLRKGAQRVTVLSGASQICIAPGSPDSNVLPKVVFGRIEESAEDGSQTLCVGFQSDKDIMEANLVFRADGSLSVLPGTGFGSLSVSADIRFGVLPGLYLDDVIYDPRDFKTQKLIQIPSENLFWCLLGDRSGTLVLAWPEGKQILHLGKEKERFSRFEIAMDQKPVYLQLQAAHGIWHKQRLELAYLEKDVGIGWQRPFDAQWKTQLLVNNVPTTWIFDRKSVRMWLPMLGFFRYPVWFDGRIAMMHLSKKIPPKGHCFIYPLGGHPKTPVEFVEKTPVAKIIQERRKRMRIDKEHSDRFPNVGYVHCWGTSILQRTIYKYGIQARERKLLNEHIGYCVDYVNRIQQQSLEYYDFIRSMRQQLDLWVEEVPPGSETLTFLEEMKIELSKVEEMYHSRVERGGRKTPQEHMAYAANLGNRLKELIQDPGQESFPEAKFILDTFNALAAATDEDVPAGFGITIRRMFQQAGSSSADHRGAIKYAEEIRKLIWEKTRTRNYETTGL